MTTRIRNISRLAILIVIISINVIIVCGQVFAIVLLFMLCTLSVLLLPVTCALLLFFVLLCFFVCVASHL